MVFIARKWRFPKVVLGLLLFEFAPIVAILALTGIASPDLYRTKLWQQGGDLGFNSKPVAILYGLANHRPVETPLVWSPFNTQFNLVISVLTMFILLTKLTMYICTVWWPIISLVVHSILVALWVVGIHAQTAGDTIDPLHKNPGAPWYITKSCSVATTSQLVNYCKQAKSTFAVSVIMLGLCAIHLFLALWSMFATKAEKAERAAEAEKEDGSPLEDLSPEEKWRRQWEAGQVPPTPGTTGGIKSPMTPRTIAFNSLGGRDDLPLRTYA